MAERTEGSTEIEASPEEIMEVITDFESYPDWSDVESAEVLDRDDQGRGTKVAYRVAMMGFSAEYTLDYAYTDSGVSWTTAEASGAVKDVRGEYELDPGEETTGVTYRLSVELGVPVPGMLRRQGEKRVVKQALDGLKRRVEEG